MAKGKGTKVGKGTVPKPVGFKAPPRSHSPAQALGGKRKPGKAMPKGMKGV